MNTYRNMSGTKGVSEYELGEESIRLKFDTTKVFIYDYKYTGKEQVEKMKILAHQGVGLNQYINQNVIKDKYSAYLD